MIIVFICSQISLIIMTQSHYQMASDLRLAAWKGVNNLESLQVKLYIRWWNYTAALECILANKPFSIAIITNTIITQHAYVIGVASPMRSTRQLPILLQSFLW